MRARSRGLVLAWVALAAAALAVSTTVVVMTPWDPLPGAVVRPAQLTTYFTPAQIARSDAYFAAARWPAWLDPLLAIAVAAVIGLTPVGRRLVSVVRKRVRRWSLQVVSLAALVIVAERLITLPGAIVGEQVSLDYGLSTQSWASWAVDVLKSLGISVVLTSLMVLVLVGLARRFTRTWFLPAAAGAGALVIVASFAYPVVIEPVFNSFTSLPAGPLRSHLLSLASRDGVQVSDVLVADASRRTTALNAYVSGFGSTKRIVVYDTLLQSTPHKQIELIVAHELGHATHDDVLVGTLEGAVVAAVAVLSLYIVLRPDTLRRRVGAGSVGDPAIVPVVLALAAIAMFFAQPVANTVSRYVEARADAHSLDLTRDPATFIALEQRLAITNLSHLDPNPVLSFWFSNHPPTLDRIGMALAWERLHGLR